MTIVIIVAAVVVVLTIGIKVRRGSFFRWGHHKDEPDSR
jgi:hypothetical protein